MRNNHPAMQHLGRKILVALACSVALAGCSGKHGEGGKEPRASDSTRAVDTTIQAPAALPVRALSYEERQGGVLYDKFCAVCHGQEGKGDGFNAFNLDPRPRDFSDSSYMKALSDDQIVQTISGGGRSVNKSPLMPAYGWTLNRQQIRNLALYVRSFRE